MKFRQAPGLDLPKITFDLNNTNVFNGLDNDLLALVLHHLRGMGLPFLICLFCVLCGFQKAGARTLSNDGYISDVSKEKSQRFYEVYFFVPHIQKDPSLQEIIFNPLSKEFKEKYRELFGQMDTESIVYRPASQGGIRETPLMFQQENQKRKEFAEFMTKRLFEYHFDRYMRTQPQMKPVMEVKEKVQNVKVEVNKEVRLNIQYNLAGNVADVVIDNPYCESKFSIEMNPKSFGPTSPKETRAWLSKNLTTVLRANSNFAMTDGIAYADLTRAFVRYQMAASIGISSAFKSAGTSPRETRYLFGFSKVF